MKVCAPESKVRECDSLDVTSNAEAQCLIVKDSADCAMKIENREADLGSFEAEELLASSSFVDHFGVVIGELRDAQVADQPYIYETVAVVRKDFEGPLANLRGKSLCHPGIIRSARMTDSVLKVSIVLFSELTVSREMMCFFSVVVF